MINRRKFVQSGLLAGTAGVLPLAGLAASTLPERLSLHQLVHDSRYPQALALSRALLGAWPGLETESRLHSVDGNITRLWLDELQPQWAAEPAFVAGVTGADVLFCLEQLAAHHDMRVLWRRAQDREVHVSADEQPLLSWLIGPRSRMRDSTLAGIRPQNNKSHINWSPG